MRESVFSSLGVRVEGARFLDLFAGTGAYGLEALSRGAGGGVFVERNRAAVKVLKENLANVERSLGVSKSITGIHCRDAMTWRPAPGERANLIFADPPYQSLSSVLPRLIQRLDDFAAPDGITRLVLETPGSANVTIPVWRCIKVLGKSGHGPLCWIWEK